MPGAVPEFFVAIEAGDEALVKDLLKRGADPNARRSALCPTWNKAPVKDGPTALMLAMRAGHDEVAKALLAAKANPLLVDQFKKTAAMYALEFGHGDMETLTFIIQGMSPKDLSQADDWGHNLIMYAALAGSPSVVDMLQKADPSGGSLSGRVKDGEHNNLDILTLSAKHGQGKVIEALLHAQFSSHLLENSRKNQEQGARVTSHESLKDAPVSRLKRIQKCAPPPDHSILP